MAENNEVKSSRERFAERMKTKYPDKEFAGDEEIFAQINDDYDAYDGELSEYQKREKELYDLFSESPTSASFLTEWKNGGDPVVMMIRKYGDDFKAALDDEEKQEEIAAANKEYAERIAKEAEFEEQYQANIQQTYDMLDKMQAEDGLAEEDVNEAMTFLIGIMRDGIVGKFSKESVQMALKAIRHDDDVELAEHAGEVKGRNAMIEEKLRKNGRNDGTASLAGKNGGGRGGSAMPELGALDRNYGAMNIYERGGEKRRAARRG